MPLFPENFLTFFSSFPAILLTWMLVTITMLQPSLLTSASLCVTWLLTFSHGKSPFLQVHFRFLISTTTSISLANITGHKQPSQVSTWTSISSSMLSGLHILPKCCENYQHTNLRTLLPLSTQHAVILCVATETDTQHKKCLEEPLQNQ